MNREDIIRMALAAGIYHEYDSEGQWDGLTNEALVGKDWLSSKEHKLDRIVEILSPFAALVAAAEREACAKVCEEKQEHLMPIPCPDGISGCLVAHYVPARREKTGNECAAAIRARGKTK